MRVLLIGRSAMLILAILTLASPGGYLLPAQGTEGRRGERKGRGG